MFAKKSQYHYPAFFYLGFFFLINHANIGVRSLDHTTMSSLFPVCSCSFVFVFLCAILLPRCGVLCAVVCCAVVCCAVCCGVLCCAAVCCTVLWCAVVCCAVVCCAVLCCGVLCCSVLCCGVLWFPPLLVQQPTTFSYSSLSYPLCLLLHSSLLVLMLLLLPSHFTCITRAIYKTDSLEKFELSEINREIKLFCP